MNKSYTHIYIIIILILIIFNLIQCNHKSSGFTVVTETIIDTIPGDSIPYVVVVGKPTITYRDTSLTNQPIVDTAAIIKEFLTKNIYKRILKDDSSAYVAITDTLFGNQLQGSEFEFQNRRVTSIITTNTTILTPAENKYNLLLGLGAGYSAKDAKVGIAPKIALQTPKNKIYTYQYDIVRGYHEAGILLNIQY